MSELTCPHAAHHFLVIGTVGRACRKAGILKNLIIRNAEYFFTILLSLIHIYLPESTLIMLVSAFCGYENTMRAYRVAVEEKYRFFSFGDAMYIG